MKNYLHLLAKKEPELYVKLFNQLSPEEMKKIIDTTEEYCQHGANVPVMGSFSFQKVELPIYDSKNDGKICECGHEYERHFDWGDDDRYTGCKYCGLDCEGWREKKNYP
jgi:hypothetical protein